MALTDKLSAIGDAIREKTGSTELMTLDDMPAAIIAIETGSGGGSDEDFISNLAFTSGKYLFAFGSWNWIIENYGDSISVNSTDLSYMFYNNDSIYAMGIPFQITYGNEINLASMFEGTDIMAIPRGLFTGVFMGNVPTSMNGMFRNCSELQSVTKEDFDWFYWSTINGTSNTIDMAGLFENCYNLKTVDTELLKNLYTSADYHISNSLLNGGFSNCYTLREINGIYPSPGSETWAWITLGSMFCLGDFTFAVQEDGTPYSRNWSGVELQLVSEVGHIGLEDFMYWNTDMTNEHLVTDAATYEAYKNEDDWWTTNIAYSRFDHDSAVRLINSLPDCSASGGTNTVKLKGESGSATDAGAINTLTADEIAVATAKGWTITLE